MKNLTEIKKEYELIPECEINNLLKCSANDLLFELGYCMWCIEKGNDTEYIKQLRDFIVTQCIYNLTFAYGE